VFEEDEIYYQEIALYKLSTKMFLKGDLVEKIIIRKYGAKILKIEEDHIIIQKTGTKVGTQKLYDELEKFGSILEFVRSGRVAVSKSKRKTKNFIKELEKIKSNKLNIK
jgi:acetolactate synthase-1/3 small subunit